MKPVFDTILKNATRICAAGFGTLWLAEGDGLRAVAVYNAPPGFAEIRRETLARPNPKTVVGRVLISKQPVQVVDIAADAAYAEGDPLRVALVEVAGMRTLLAVPMLKENELVGTINIYRQEVQAFTDEQIALLQNFAAQAVIAVENTRLLNELKQSLEQQTATADVLRVISSSPGELEAVFRTILENATRICEAKFGILNLYENGGLCFGAMHNVPSAFADWLQSRRGAYQPILGSPPDRVIRTKKVSHVLDNTAEPAPGRAATLGGARTTVSVPMLKDDELIGIITIFRQEVRAFTDEQIALLANFANQAVIAIENARLLSELRQRTADLSESLEQQTATSEVLKVISSAPGELNAVFEAILSNATRICEATYGNLLLWENGAFRRAAQCNAPQELIEEFQSNPVFIPLPNNPLDRVLKTKETVHTVDAQAESNLGLLANARTLLNVPMLSHGDLIGTISIYRQEVRPFTEKHIALVENFAAQAVIAIENARLLNDLNKLNQQLEQRVADQVGEIERMSRLRRFLPPQVADLIVASGTEKQLESHRREITALFCDLRGFTGFSESSDPEDVMALLAEYHAAIGEIIIKYSGTLERYAGDGVMVIFNDPVPVENPALQAVLMALEMRTAIGALIAKWRDLGHDLGFGIGIAHGFATLGTIGFEGRRDYAAIGTVSNVASRLCDEAKPGQILISPRVRQAVEKAVTVEPVDEFTLKGIRRPMQAYNVLKSSSSKPN